VAVVLKEIDDLTTLEQKFLTIEQESGKRS